MSCVDDVCCDLWINECVWLLQEGVFHMNEHNSDGWFHILNKKKYMFYKAIDLKIFKFESIYFKLIAQFKLILRIN
jgi:hypothetical protein